MSEHTPAPGGKLSFHGVDTWSGATVRTLRVDIARLDGSEYRALKTVDTAANGRSDGAWLEGPAFQRGCYELTLHLDDYYRALGASLTTPPFLARVPIRFGVSDARERWHVVVLFGPWSYAYYRGS